MPGRRASSPTRWILWLSVLLLPVMLMAGCAAPPPVLSTRGPPPEAALTRNRVAMLIAGGDALAARLDLIDRARKRIVFQYYLFHADDSGRLLAAALLRAADRGVEVRGLVDDMHGADNRLLKALDAHPRIQIRRYRPFRLDGLRLLETVLDFRRVGRRMHNKQLTVDGRASIVGGRNLGDEYFGLHRHLAFADLDVLVEGPAATGLERSFEDYWTAPQSRARGRDDPERVARLRATLARWSTGPGQALAATLYRSQWWQARRRGEELPLACPTQVLADVPEKFDSAHPVSPVGRQLGVLLRGAEEEVLLVSAYFVPGRAGAATLAERAAHGVRVVVVTNSLASTDVPAVHAGYARYRGPLLREGVELWETRGGPASSRGKYGDSQATLHTKAYFFDRRYLFVGSFNLDPRSATLNTENGLLFDCPALAGPVAGAILEALPGIALRLRQTAEGHLRWEGAAGVWTREPGASPWRRLQAWLLQWLPVEAEL